MTEAVTNEMIEAGAQAFQEAHEQRFPFEVRLRMAYLAMKAKEQPASIDGDGEQFGFPLTAEGIEETRQLCGLIDAKAAEQFIRAMAKMWGCSPGFAAHHIKQDKRTEAAEARAANRAKEPSLETVERRIMELIEERLCIIWGAPVSREVFAENVRCILQDCAALVRPKELPLEAVERASIRISERVWDHLSNTLDMDDVPDRVAEDLTVKFCDIAADEARAAIASMDGLREWQPIETCHESGALRLVWLPEVGRPAGGYQAIAFTALDGWQTEDGEMVFPTHWMKLPEPPARAATASMGDEKSR